LDANGIPEVVKTQWTIYPNGVPVRYGSTYSCHTRPSDGKILIMIEASEPDPSNWVQIRSLEVLRHTTSMITLYDTCGQIVLQNFLGETELVPENGATLAPIDENKSTIDPEHFLPYFKERQDVFDLIETVNKGDHVVKKVKVRLRKGKKTHLVHASKVVDPVTGKDAILIQEEDITLAVRQQKENLAFKMANKYKDEFLANTSHELRTPLHGIIGLTEDLISTQSAALTEEAKDTLQIVVSCARRLTDLVNGILDLAKLNREIRLTKKVTLLQSVAEEVIRLSTPLAMIKQIQIKSSVPKNLPPVLADEARVKQVLHNLMGNAIKFCDKGIVEISVKEECTFIRVDITDNGIGIPSQALKTIFEPFFQPMDRENRTKYGGTGLGLPIAKKLIELHGGTINVKSSPGNGSTFTFTIPVYVNEQDKDLMKTNDVHSDENNSNTRKSLEISTSIPSTSQFLVLSVDDDPVNQKIISNIIVKQGIQCKKAMNGEECLKYLEKSTPDLILLDWMMPGLSGIEVCKLVRQNYGVTIPIVMVSARNQSENAEEGRKAGANDFVTKPFSRELLLKTVFAQLGGGFGETM